MANKKLIILIGAFIILILAGFLISSEIFNVDANKIKNPELEKYRSEKIPQDCRLAEYENNVESWKEHLSHHENTLYCLDYYK